MKPHLQEEFRQLCCPEQKESNELLFGHSLNDNVKSVGDSLKPTFVIKMLVPPHSMLAQKKKKKKIEKKPPRS